MPAWFSSHAEAQSHDEEAAGHSRGGYAWGEEHHDEAAGPTVHHYGRVFASLGVGGTVRVVQYVSLAQDRLAPPYLQLRGGYFFEGDGMFQHGIVLGLATALAQDGTLAVAGPPDPLGVTPGSQWSLAPAYMVRLIPEGDLGNWFQATGRIGIPFALGDQFSWGWEAGLGMLIKPLEGIGIYGEIDFSMYFASDVHPLVSFEIGLAVDYEVLP